MTRNNSVCDTIEDHSSIKDHASKLRARLRRDLPAITPLIDQYAALDFILNDKKIYDNMEDAHKFIYLGAGIDIAPALLLPTRWKLVDDYHVDDNGDHHDNYFEASILVPRSSTVKKAKHHRTLDDFVERCGTRLVFYRAAREDYATDVGKKLLPKADYIITDGPAPSTHRLVISTPSLDKTYEYPRTIDLPVERFFPDYAGLGLQASVPLILAAQLHLYARKDLQR